MKKVLSVLLAVVIILGTSPLEGLAEKRMPNWQSTGIEASAVSINDLKYRLFNEETEVEITYCDKEVTGDFIIPSSVEGKPVTSIGHDAFAECVGITRIDMPNTIVKIDDFAFHMCTGLTNITLSENIEYIGDSSFSLCNNMLTINLPNSLKYIGDCAFSDCRRMTSITIPENILYVGVLAFAYCESITTVNFNALNCNTMGTNLNNNTAFAYCYSFAYLNIGENVRKIPKYAFLNCTNLCDVIVPDSVISIGYQAFGNTPWYDNQPEGPVYAGKVLYCYNGNMPFDTELLINTDTVGIADYAFQYCGSNLKSINIPNTVQTIGEGAFRNCVNLHLTNLSDSLTSIGNYSFENCEGLTDIAFGDGVTSIGDYAFSGCIQLENITVSNGLSNLGEYAFYQTLWYGNWLNTQSEDVQYIGKVACGYNGTAQNISINPGTISIAPGAFSGNFNLTSISIPNSVTNIGRFAFSSCTNLGSIVIPNSVNIICDGTFSNCTSLSSITIPESVTSIGSYAFSYCTSITSISLPESITEVGNNSFEYCTALSNFITGDGVKYLGSYAFSHCTGLISVTIGISANRIDSGAFINCNNIQTINYNATYLRLSSSFFENAPFYCLNSIENLNIGDSVLKIDLLPLYDCDNIKSITISDNVLHIGSNAFNFLLGLENIYVSEDNQKYSSINGILYSKDNKILVRCPISRSDNITIPNGVKSIAESAFYYCNRLTYINIPNSLTNIGANAFFRCSELQSIYIPELVSSIGDGAFNSCYFLTDINIPRSVTSIGDQVFDYCYNLTVSCYEGSYALDYVINNHISYKILSSNTCIISASTLSNTIYLKFYNKDNGLVLNNKATTINGVSYIANSNGEIQVTKDSSSLVTIAVSGYYDYICDKEMLCKIQNNIYLEPLKETTKPYVSSVYYINITAVSDWKDASCDDMKIPQNSTEKFEIRVFPNWRNHEAGKIVLSQDGTHKIESTTGVFSNVELSDAFIIHKKIYAYCVSSNGVISRTYELKIRIVESVTGGLAWAEGNSILTENVKLFEDVSVIIPNSVPLLNGQEFGLKIGAYSVSVKRDGNKFKAAIGVGLDKKYYESDDKIFDKDEWNIFKSAVKQVKEGAGKINDFKGFKAKTADSKLFANKSISAELVGYIEYEYVNDSPVVTDMGGYLRLNGSVSKAFYFPCAFPVYIDVELGIELKAQVNGARATADNELPFDLAVIIDADLPYLQLGIATGIKGVLSAGVYGKGAFNTQIRFADKFYKFSLKAEAAAKVQTLIFEYNFDIWDSGDEGYLLGSGTWGKSATKMNVNSPSSNPTEKFDIYDTSNYNKIANRDYEKNTKWLGMKMQGGAATNNIEPSGSEATTLQTSIYKDSRQQLVECNGQKMLFWITDNTTRSPENRTMLVYSIYNESNDTWSSPQAIADDGTADFYPNAVTDGTNVYVTWQNSKTSFTVETATLENYADAGEICVAKYNSSTGTIEATQTITNNSTLDTTPVLVCKDGIVKVVWVNNNAGDIFGLEGSNSINVSTLSNGTWSSADIIRNGLTSIHSLDVTLNNNKLYVAYAYDMDNNYNDTSDLEIFQTIYDGTNTITKRLTENAVFDTAPQYGTIGNETKLYWYSEGNLYTLNNLDSSNFSTAFAQPTNINDTFTIAQTDGDISYIVWSQLVNEHVEFYATEFEDTAWSEPVKISSTDNKALNPSAIIDDNGTLCIAFNGIKQDLVNENGFTYYEDGQTDLCILKVFQSANIAISNDNLNIDCADIVPNGKIDLDVIVNNEGTVSIDSVDVMINDTYFSTVAVTLLPGQSKDISLEYTLPGTITKQKLNLTIKPSGTDDYDLSDNSVSADYGFTELAVSDVTVDDTSFNKTINSTISNQSCMDTGSFIIRIYEDYLYGKIVHEETVLNLTPGQVCLFNYSIEKSSISYNGDTLKKYYIEVATNAEEYKKGNNSEGVSFSQVENQGVSVNLLKQEIDGTNVKVYAAIQNDATYTNEVFARIEIKDLNGNIIGNLQKKIELEAKEVYTLEEIVAIAGINDYVTANVTLHNCGTVESSGCIIDYGNNYIYGLANGINSLNGYIDTANGYDLSFIPTPNGFGTGSIANIRKNGGIVESYKIIIFGDVNGDSSIDSIDAGNIVDYENYIVSWNPITDAALFKAGDLNGDGSIDSIDAGIAVDAENYLVTIEQTTGLATQN